MIVSDRCCRRKIQEISPDTLNCRNYGRRIASANPVPRPACLSALAIHLQPIANRLAMNRSHEANDPLHADIGL
jgi:hypothetical protein